jgi:Carboxypeptidase regulatory-like domain
MPHNTGMPRRIVLANAALLLAVSLMAISLTAAPPTTQLSIHVLTPGGKPLDRASVIVKFVSGSVPLKIKKFRTQWETKTDQDGFARISSIPQGKVQIQIIAANYQTFGQLFDVDQDEKTIEIKLNPPQDQYSAHEK